MVAASVTYYDALLRLSACQIWMRLGRTKDGRWYGPKRFQEFEALDTTLKDSGRKTFLRLANMHRCYACGAPVNPLADGDHVIPKSKGGASGAENFAPMCAKCNSSKGSKDMLEWWAVQGKTLELLNPDVMVVFVRIMYFLLSENGLLDTPAPGPTTYLLDRFAASLPTQQHIDAFNNIHAPPSYI